MSAPLASGFAVRVIRDGTLIDWLHDAVGFAKASLFTQLLTAGSVVDGLAILREAQQGLLTAPWRLGVVDRAGAEHDFVTVASRDGDDIVVVGAPSADDTRALLQQIKPQFEVDVFAQLLRQLDAATHDDTDVETRALIELSLTNNELMGLHRQSISAKTRLRRLDERKDQLLGMVAHDLRNPLGSIAGFAGTIRRQLNDDTAPSVLVMLDRIERLSRQMLEIVDDLVDVSAIQSNRLTLDLDNIINNAVKYSPANAGAVIRIEVRDTDVNVIIAVSDQGAGIPEGEHEAIFAPFHTAGIAPTGDERSIGLGLPIAKNIIDAHGGTIELESDVGTGSTFTVTVPKAPPTASDGGPMATG
ncbi:MAG: HAMP domain-containing sensor histidine kinase [Nitriliruptoraceae bacterium]